MLDYGGGGEVELSTLKNELNRPGLKMVFEDQGPGIANPELALTDGYTTGGGLGMGLSGSKRLMSEFKLETEVGKGTRVTVTKWK
jgi:serine/threonine-protein kinase RsbT